MRTDVKIGIVVGLLLAIVFVVYFIATSGPEEQSTEPKAAAGQGTEEQEDVNVPDEEPGGYGLGTDEETGGTDFARETFDQDRGRVASDTRDRETGTDGGLPLDRTRETADAWDSGTDYRSTTEDARPGEGFASGRETGAGDGTTDAGNGFFGPADADDEPGGGRLVDEGRGAEWAPGGQGGTTETREPAAGSGATYEVQPGDTLGEIAAREYGSSRYWKDIAKANPGVRERALRVGTRLKLPDISVVRRSEGQRPSPGEIGDLPAGYQAHRVKEGDTFAGLAKQYYGSAQHWYRIAKANPEARERALQVGTVLQIPPPPEEGEAPAAAGAGGGREIDVPQGWSTYKVQSGDTLSEISEKVYQSSRFWPAIRKANPGIQERALQVGRTLLIPPRPETAPRIPRTAETTEREEAPVPVETEFPRPDFGP